MDRGRRTLGVDASIQEGIGTTRIHSNLLKLRGIEIGLSGFASKQNLEPDAIDCTPSLPCDSQRVVQIPYSTISNEIHLINLNVSDGVKGRMRGVKLNQPKSLV